jgi:hypothetical protein
MVLIMVNFFHGIHGLVSFWHVIQKLAPGPAHFFSSRLSLHPDKLRFDRVSLPTLSHAMQFFRN